MTSFGYLKLKNRYQLKNYLHSSWKPTVTADSCYLFAQKSDTNGSHELPDAEKRRVIALGAGLGIWGAVNLMEGYGNDNPGAKSQGMKQLMAGGGVALIGTTLVPLLAGLFG